METAARDFLQQLIETPSPSGYEQAIQRVVREWIEPAADEVKKDLYEIEAGELLIALGDLDEGQKDWYIFTMASMIEADGKILEVEIEYAKIFLEHMEITTERVERVKRESQLLSGYFRS